MGIGQESPSFDLSAVSSMRGGLRESGSVGGGSASRPWHKCVRSPSGPYARGCRAAEWPAIAQRTLPVRTVDAGSEAPLPELPWMHP